MASQNRYGISHFLFVCIEERVGTIQPLRAYPTCGLDNSHLPFRGPEIFAAAAAVERLSSLTSFVDPYKNKTN